MGAACQALIFCRILPEREQAVCLPNLNFLDSLSVERKWGKVLYLDFCVHESIWSDGLSYLPSRRDLEVFQ